MYFKFFVNYEQNFFKSSKTNGSDSLIIDNIIPEKFFIIEKTF